MPKGTLDFPRLTTFGPFVDIQPDQELTINIDENRRFPDTGIPDRLLEEGLIDSLDADRIRLELIVREDISTEEEGILGEIITDVKELTRDKSIARASYWLSQESSVAIVGKVEVNEGLRGYGIGTELKKKLIEDMSGRGANIAYTITITEAGRSLAMKTGFKPDDEVFADDEDVLVRRL